MKIAIVCDNASFTKGGEAAIPLRFFRAFRQLGLKPQLLSHARVEPDLRASLTADELNDVTLFSDLKLQKIVYRLGLYLPGRVREAYTDQIIRLATEARQRKELRQRAKARDIDCVFVPIPISPKAISLITDIGVPVFFGPLNGVMDYPPGMRDKTSEAGKYLIAAGRYIAEPLHYIFPAKRNAAGLFYANDRTLANLPVATKNVPRFRSFDATIDAANWQNVDRSGAIDPTHFVYVGRLIDWKAVDLAIEAIHRLEGRARLTIVGEGPERPRLEKLAASGKGSISFVGFKGHEEIVEIYQDAAALLLPSMREAGGNVCLEALAAGVPVIATRWGGAEDVVQDGVDGILVDPIDRASFITGFADAIQQLMDDPARIRVMGEAGRARVLVSYDWQTKARQCLQTFEQAIAAKSNA